MRIQNIYINRIRLVRSMKKISDLRAEAGGITQEDLAHDLNVTQASVSRWEKDQLRINGANLIKLALYFDISVDAILGIEDQITKE